MADPQRWSAPRKLTEYTHVNLFLSEMNQAGRRRHWMFASRRDGVLRETQTPDAVVVIGIVDASRNPRLVLTREFRVPLRTYEISVPSGLVDEGESVAQAAARELREETGLTLDRLVHVSPPLASSAGLTDETVSLVYGEVSGSLSRDGQTEDEEIVAWLADIDEIRTLIDQPGADVISSRLYPVLVGFVSAGRIALPELA